MTISYGGRNQRRPAFVRVVVEKRYRKLAAGRSVQLVGNPEAMILDGAQPPLFTSPASMHVGAFEFLRATKNFKRRLRPRACAKHVKRQSQVADTAGVQLMHLDVKFGLHGVQSPERLAPGDQMASKSPAWKSMKTRQTGL